MKFSNKLVFTIAGTVLALIYVLGMLAFGDETETEQVGKEVTVDVASIDASSLEGKSITLLTPYMGSVTTNQMVNYMTQELEGAKANVSLVDTDNDFSELASRIEDVVSSGTDAMILVSADPNQLANQLQEAFNAGIPVYGIDSGFIDGMAVNATSDNYAMGEQIGHYLFDDLMGGKGTLIMLTHRPHPGIVKRCQAIDDMLEEYTDIALITEQHVPAEQPINDAQDIMADLILANPEEGSITAVWAAWDEAAIGATQALQEAGRDEVIVTGVDGNEQAIELIIEGTNLKATLMQNFDGMCDIIYSQLVSHFNGNETDSGELYAASKLITPQNAADFE